MLLALNLSILVKYPHYTLEYSCCYTACLQESNELVCLWNSMVKETSANKSKPAQAQVRPYAELALSLILFA